MMLQQGKVLRQLTSWRDVSVVSPHTNAADAGAADQDEWLDQPIEQAQPVQHPSTQSASIDQKPAVVSIGQIVRHERLLAIKQAEQMLEQAKKRAAQLEQDAAGRVQQLFDDVEANAVQEAQQKLAESWLLLEKRAWQLEQTTLEQSVAIARIVAERLIGEHLQLEPEHTLLLAREAMGYLRRAHHITVYVHADDVKYLEENLADFGVPEERIQVVADPNRKRASLKIVSDCGQFDCDLNAQLDRLCAAIRQQLHSSESHS